MLGFGVGSEVTGDLLGFDVGEEVNVSSVGELVGDEVNTSSVGELDGSEVGDLLGEVVTFICYGNDWLEENFMRFLRLCYIQPGVLIFKIQPLVTADKRSKRHSPRKLAVELPHLKVYKHSLQYH